MLFLYRILINLILLISPLILVVRLIKKKEDFKRFKEKFCFFTEKKDKGNIIWFHGASVGELQSIVPLLENLEKNNKINKVLVTSNTLSSSKILQKLKLKKVIHQFFPIDTNFHTQKFLNYWNPKVAFFIDSEVWPNMYFNLKKKQIPIILLNGRITKKSFSKWNYFPRFSKKIFGFFNLCLTSNRESKKYLKKLGAKNIKFFGNIKFAQSEHEKVSIDGNLKKFIFEKKTWCASSTHNTEEKFCGFVHKELKKKIKNLLTIIIPRHIERVDKVEKELKSINLKTHIYSSNNKLNKDTDILIVDAYGKTKTFYNFCNNIFLGGSLINHGGQNPLEATRYGCNILHGPNVGNFSEIYDFLKKNKMSQQIKSQKEMSKNLKKFFLKKTNSKKIQKKLKFIGQKILSKTYREIQFYIG